MKTEKVILFFVAIVIGLLVAGGAFFIYQSTKRLPKSETQTVSSQKPSPTPTPSVNLVIERPSDEEVVEEKTITVAGQTTPESTVVVSTLLSDEVLEPSRDGKFSTTVTLEDGVNIINVTAISKNGEETSLTRTVTFTAEEF